MRPLIPRDVLFGNPERVGPALSPDGRKLAYIAPDDGVLNVWVRSIGQDDDKAVTSDRDRGVRQFFWAHDGRHLLFLQDRGGDENWRLYDVDLITGDERDLTPFDEVQVQVVDLSKHHPDTVLLAINKDNPQLHDVYRLTLSTGALEKTVDNPGFVGWLADRDQRVRAAAAPSPDGGFAVMARDSESSEWRAVHSASMEDALSLDIVSFTEDGAALYLTSAVDANASRLIRVDVATGEVQAVIADDGRYDVTATVLHPDTREPQLVAFLKDRIEWHALDPAVENDLEAVQALHPGDFVLVGRDAADTTWLAGFTADNGPISYYAYDRQKSEATFLFVHEPKLAEYELASMEPFTFSASDGLEVSGYVTFPVGVERSALPAVVNVHGGPWVRDTWGYDPEAQWLADRGYACIQVNYRGSTGYGKDFTNAGNREWAGKMHTDLLDAIDFLAGKGWIDPARVAIYGGSYGGYAALVGATFTPERFVCAVDIVGPSSIKTLIESVPPYWMPAIAQFHARVGNPDTEEDFLWSRSPLSRVDNVSIPLLIAQGANDPRVKQAESEQFVEALKEKGIPHEYMLFPDEGHGFAKPENRLTFYAAAEHFLARHLGGRCEEAPSTLAD